MEYTFKKMHALGNDFVIIDAADTANPVVLEDAVIKRLCDRHLGIGCDQLIILDKPAGTDFKMRIYNQDASPSGACGNASRCVASLSPSSQTTIAVGERVLHATKHEDNSITVDMGVYHVTPSLVPLKYDVEYPFEIRGLKGYAVNVGNPHFVVKVDEVEALPIAQFGPILECDDMFPQRANINFVEITGDSSIKLRVWERGAGATLACGSGACASAVVCTLFMGMPEEITVYFKHGELNIRVLPHSVLMRGPVTLVFEGAL